MENTFCLPNISNWKKSQGKLTHVLPNLKGNQLNILKTFIKNHSNYNILKKEDNLILCKEE